MRVAAMRRNGRDAMPNDATDAGRDGGSNPRDGGRPDRAAGLLHDLRDALSTISAAVLLMRAGGLPDDQQPYLTAIEAASEKMDALTQLIHDQRSQPDHADSGPRPAQPVATRMADIAEPICATLAVRCQAVGLVGRFTLAEDVPGLVRIDKVRLLRVLDNLVANAAAATRGRKDGSVDVTIAIDGGDLVFSVADNGPGLGDDPERWFAQGTSGTPEHSGLGLWVARRSAQAMSATLDARNDPKGGAVFTLRVPNALSTVDDTQALSHEPLGSVLVVDGNPVGREFIRAILANLDADVVSAGTIAEAVMLASERRFGLALIDMGLPDGTGRDLAERLRRLQPTMKIYAMSGQSARASAAIAEGLFAGLLQRPIDPRALGRLFQEVRDGAD